MRLPYQNLEFQEFQHDDFEEEQVWDTKVVGTVPRKPHHEAEDATAKAIDIEFGWNKTNDIFGFCLSDSEYYFQ